MFISCPHCRELVATDPQTRLPPAMCPRCGGGLEDPIEPVLITDDAASPGKRSFASFLQHEPQSVADDLPGETVEATGIAEPTTTTDPVAPDVDALQEEPVVVDQDDAADAITDLAADAADAPDVIAPLEIHAPTGTDSADSIAALPRFTQATAARSSQRPVSKWQIALLLALGLLLGLQILIADRERLAADESWRPLITRLCDALGCSVPAWHQPGAFTMLNRDVRPVANLLGGLEAQATFRNDAAWPQAWPLLLLSLSDADGRVVGTRHFTPAEYLGKDIPQPELAPGQSAQVTFRLREPDAGVVAFSFDFR